MNHGLEGFVERSISSSIRAKQALLADDAVIALIAEVAGNLARAMSRGHRLLVFGNGGSAADAQHIVAELVGRFQFDRPALPAIALTVNSSCLTAIANDISYAAVFSRQIEALGAPGDFALGISTSGNSPNVLRGVEAANRKGLITIGLTGESGGRLREVTQRCICAPSPETPRIQEMHILIGHIICEIVEREIFGEMSRASEPTLEMVAAPPFS